MLGVEQRDAGKIGKRFTQPTTIGTPRERASMATWLAVLPAFSAMPPPWLQSVSRKRVGAMSSPHRMAPEGAVLPPSSVRARSTWSLMSRKSVARARK